MKHDFLLELLGNALRVKLVRLFVHSSDGYTQQEVQTRIGGSTRSVNREALVLKKMRLIVRGTSEREKGKSGKMTKVAVWKYNVNHEHAATLSAFVRDTTPAARHSVLDKLRGAGRLRLVIATGALTAHDQQMGRADLLIVGDSLNERKLSRALKNIESESGREITYAQFSVPEFKYRFDVYDRLVRDVIDYPHTILLDTLKYF